MKSGILHALEKSLDRIYNNYPVENEIDFQSVLFGELYKQFPDAIIRFEHRLKSDYQSYARRGSITKNRKSRVDLHLSYASQTIVIELKYFKGSSLEERTDMLADIAKVERIVEAKEANEGFCIHLVKEGIISRLPSEIETKKYEIKVGRWDYNFEIKGIYEVNSTKALCGRSFIVHHIK